MAEQHDRAANKIAKRYDGAYDSTSSPDVKTPYRRIEVKSTASEIPTAVAQLGRTQKLRYVALPASEIPAARKSVPSHVGLMNHNGDIVKRARSKGH